MRGASGGGGKGSQGAGSSGSVNPYEGLDREHRKGRERAANEKQARSVGSAITRPTHEAAASPAVVRGNEWAARASALARQVHGKLFGTYPQPGPQGTVITQPVTRPTALGRSNAQLEVRQPNAIEAVRRETTARTAEQAAGSGTVRADFASLSERGPGQQDRGEPSRPGRAPTAAVDLVYERVAAKASSKTAGAPTVGVAHPADIIASRNPKVARELTARKLYAPGRAPDKEAEAAKSDDLGMDAG